jgi:ADP-L-glycero-D-manno-heptose 6-epimerase
MVWQLSEQIKNGNPKIFKDGEQKRDYIYVKDVVRANLIALNKKQSGIYNCGSGLVTTFNELVKILCDVLGEKRETEYIDNPYIKFYQDHTECDMNLSREKLGFMPEFDIKKGIADYFQNGL